MSLPCPTAATGARYQVVIDFSGLEVGDEVILYNDPTTWSEVRKDAKQVVYWSSDLLTIY